MYLLVNSVRQKSLWEFASEDGSEQSLSAPLPPPHLLPLLPPLDNKGPPARKTTTAQKHNDPHDMVCSVVLFQSMYFYHPSESSQQSTTEKMNFSL